MGDLICRQAAIDALKQQAEEMSYWSERYEEQRKGVLTAVNVVSDLPSAQPPEASCWGCNCPKMERLKEQKTFSEMVHLHDAERREE